MKLIEIHGYKILLLKGHIESETLPNPDEADAWIINSESQWHIRRFLRKVIRTKDPKFFLQPIFLQDELIKDKDDVAFFRLENLSDGYIKNLDITEKIPLIERVRSFIATYKMDSEELDSTSRNIQNLFYYYYTRRRKLIPVRNPKSLTGYSYPRLEAFFMERSGGYEKIKKFLKLQVDEGLLTREYVNTFHLCSHCSSGFLNYREKCPKCNGHNLSAVSIIHHFRCAYVGKETDFKRNGHLICPKCSAELRNLGVDYDKPGKSYLCLNDSCNSEFQKTKIGVQCIECGTEQQPADLTVEKIYQYDFTPNAIYKIINI